VNSLGFAGMLLIKCDIEMRAVKVEGQPFSHFNAHA